MATRIEQQIDRWLHDQEKKAGAALKAIAPGFAATAQGTDSYQDDTGANRAATGSFVVGLGIDQNAVAEGLAREADRLNEGHAFLTTVPGPPDGVGQVITTTATSYAIHLERDGAGAHAYLGDALYSEAPEALQLLTVEMRRLNGGT
jgi:hypothetical protein